MSTLTRYADELKKARDSWPKGPLYWMEDDTLCVSIPFTYNLPEVKYKAQQVDLFMPFNRVEVGGPAVALIPDFFDGLDFVTISKGREGVLQRINPYATRTTLGCTRSCGYCAIGTGRVEGGGMVELAEWPNLPLKCDNNFFAASDSHICKSLTEDIDRGYVDYNQGLDARYLTKDIAEMLAQIKKPIIRLSLDHNGMVDEWENAIEILLSAGVAKTNINTYALVGFRESPEQSWKRCEFITGKGITINPMWYHSLDCLKKNIVTPEQGKHGWTDKNRTQLMGWYYMRRGKKPEYLK
jgi:hypothetical protein